VLAAVIVLIAVLVCLWTVRKPIVAWWTDLWTVEEGQSLPEGAVQFHFVDVGQGDCILITTPWGNALVDAGSNSSEQALARYLEMQGIESFAYAVFTHPDEDHIGAADMVLSSYATERALIPDVTEDSVAYGRLIEKAAEGHVQVIKARAGMTFHLGDVCFDVLAPTGSDYKETNDYSIVLKVTYGERSVLLTGDATVLSETEMLQVHGAEKLNCDLLKVGHHGAGTSTSDEFVRAVSPRYAVISVGEGNAYDHPRTEILERLEQAGTRVYRTDVSGTVSFATDGERWYVRE
jgi:competence protein ComEC